MFYAFLFLLAVGLTVGVWFAAAARPASSRGSTAHTEADQAPTVEAWADAQAPEVMVANHSSRPVHEVRAFVALGRRRRPTCVGWIRTLPPTGDEAARVALTADSRESWLRWRDGRSRDPLDVAVEVTYRDHTGRHWRRDRSGALTAIKS